jgi:hypothetical protein
MVPPAAGRCRMDAGILLPGRANAANGAPRTAIRLSVYYGQWAGPATPAAA